MSVLVKGETGQSFDTDLGSTGVQVFINDEHKRIYFVLLEVMLHMYTIEHSENSRHVTSF